MKLGYARAVLVVHNIAHQGRTHCDDVWKLGLPDHHTGAFYLDDPQAGVCIRDVCRGILFVLPVIFFWLSEMCTKI